MGLVSLANSPSFPFSTSSEAFAKKGSVSSSGSSAWLVLTWRSTSTGEMTRSGTFSEAGATRDACGAFREDACCVSGAGGAIGTCTAGPWVRSTGGTKAEPEIAAGAPAADPGAATGAGTAAGPGAADAEGTEKKRAGPPPRLRNARTRDRPSPPEAGMRPEAPASAAAPLPGRRYAASPIFLPEESVGAYQELLSIFLESTIDDERGKPKNAPFPLSGIDGFPCRSYRKDAKKTLMFF